MVSKSRTLKVKFKRPELRIAVLGDKYEVNAFSGIAYDLNWKIQMLGLKRKLNKSIFENWPRM